MNRSLGAAVGVSLLVAASTALTQDKPPRGHEQMQALHHDARAYAAMLDDPARDAWQKPHEVLMALGLRPGETVADIGSGSGYFSLRFARHVGEAGLVYAVDVDPDLVRLLNRRLRETGLRNVRTVLADPDDPLLPDASVDRFVIVDTWHHIGSPDRYLSAVKRMLKPGGQLVMIDFHKKELPVGPPPSMKIAREDLVRQLEAAGLRLAREHTFLPYQYFLVFEVKAD